VRIPRLTQSDLWLAAKASTLTVAVAALYYQDLALIFNDALKNDATSYILVIPILLAYLIYRKRKMLRATVAISAQEESKKNYYATLGGILLSSAAVILYWYGSYTFTPLEYHIFSMPLLVAGLTLVLFNPQTLRQALFPIVFLFLLVPPPSEILYGFGSALSVFSSEASAAIVQLFRIPATLTGEYGTPTIIITRPDNTTIPFTVDIACSGIYSIIGFFVFAAFVAFIVRDKTWKKLSIFLIGLPLIYFLNIVRITTLLAIGYQVGADLALQVFHLLGGWILIFIGTLLLLVASEKLFKTRLFSPRGKSECPECAANISSHDEACSACGKIKKYPRLAIKREDVVKIAGIAIVIALLLWIQMPTFALARSPAPILVTTSEGTTGNTELFPSINGYNLSFEYRDTTFEQAAQQDFSLIFFYTPQESYKVPVWLGVEIASTTESLHRWETCLITWPETHQSQPQVRQLELRDVKIMDNPPVTARYFAFQYLTDNQTQLVLYWYENTFFTINNSTQQKYVKLSLITYPDSPQDVSNIELQLLPMAEAISAHWEPVRTWAIASILISQHGTELLATTTILLIVLVMLYLNETKKQSNASLNAYQKLSRQNQQLVDAVQKSERHNMPTLNRIKQNYEATSGRKTDAEALQRRLSDLEKTGIIKRVTGTDQDEPIKTWKTQTDFFLYRIFGIKNKAAEGNV